MMYLGPVTLLPIFLSIGPDDPYTTQVMKIQTGKGHEPIQLKTKNVDLGQIL